MRASIAAASHKTLGARAGGTAQALTDFVSYDGEFDTIEGLRVQFLRVRFGVSRHAAGVFAQLAWGADGQ